MTVQPSLWDPPDRVAARIARDDGIARAEAHAPDEFKVAAVAVIEGRASTGRPFTADDLWADLVAADATMPDTPAALGPIVLAAARRREIVKTGRLVPSVFARRHRDLVEWIGAGE